MLASAVAVDAAGHASFSTAALAEGSHVVTAVFSGSAGWGNSTGTNTGAPQVVNPVATTQTATFTSVAAQDGWVLESSEASNAGGSISPTSGNGTSLRVGDDNKNKQYKSILTFDISALPDNATIVSVAVRLRRESVSGTNPFSTHGTCWVDVHAGPFSGSALLQTSDFQAAATVVQSATLSDAASNGLWSEGTLNAAGTSALSKTGTTQLRVLFAVDDNNNNRNDYVGYFAGESSTAANRPQLVVTYK